jgi:hypothetical protein
MAVAVAVDMELLVGVALQHHYLLKTVWEGNPWSELWRI